MKKLLFFALVPFFTALWSCSGGTGVSIAATGKPYEIFVVAQKEQWNGVVGDSLRSIAAEEVLWVNQPEPIFDLYNITPKALNNITKRHRNLIIAMVNPKLDSVQFSTTDNKWADGQVVVEIQAPSDSVMADFIAAKGDELITFFHNLEQNRMATRAARYSAEFIDKTIKDKFDFKMTIPRGYRIANDTTDFLWLTYELPLVSQGVVIYSFDRPAGDTTTSLHPVVRRNLAVRQVPGPVPGSYMSSDTVFTPESIMVEIDSTAWIETRGFWNVKGDFMGGPFINYLTLNPKTNRYIGIDLYVYSPSPRYPKRNYIRQMESLMLGVGIDK